MSEYHANIGHVPRKRFGQHFLHDQGILRRIVECVSPQSGDRMIEIGPGEGAMTLPLLRAAGKLTAIELDRDLIEPLREKSRGIGELEIINADVLNVDFSALGQSLRIVGNLPYNISTPILFHCLEHSSSIRDMHFMLQKEVVERMASEPGSKVYGRLSVMLQAICTVTPLFSVPPGAFRPPPKVDSAVVRLVPKTADQIGIRDPILFELLVRNSFGQRRKTLRNAVQALCTGPDIEAAGLRPDARAEQLAVADFIHLANHLALTAQAAQVRETP
jgi:16S rRNA (adenine1518-N6/adenine1519-N6)-dimethyltransferase